MIYKDMNGDENGLKQTIVRLPESMYQELKDYAAGVGMSVNEFVKRAIREKIDRDTGVLPLESRIAVLEEKIEAMELYIKATQSEP